MLLSRLRFQDNTVVCNADIALFALDLDGVGTFLGRPGEMDVAGSGRQIESDRCGILERPFPKPALFERCGNTARNSGPAYDAIERMPAVIEQDTAACYRRIGAPVCAPLRHHGDSRLRAQRLP